MKKLNRLPEAELTVMRAVWRLEPPVPHRGHPHPAGEGAAVESVRPSDPAGPADRAGLPVRGEGGAAERLYPLVDEGEYLAFENAPFLEGRGLPGLGGRPV